MSVVLNLSEAEQFVATQRILGSEVRWDGYTMVFWKPSHHGFKHVSGAYRKGRWGMEVRVPVSTDGTWKVAQRHVRDN